MNGPVKVTDEERRQQYFDDMRAANERTVGFARKQLRFETARMAMAAMLSGPGGAAVELASMVNVSFMIADLMLAEYDKEPEQ